jgi:hypothetical protein
MRWVSILFLLLPIASAYNTFQKSATSQLRSWNLLVSFPPLGTFHSNGSHRMRLQGMRLRSIKCRASKHDSMQVPSYRELVPAVLNMVDRIQTPSMPRLLERYMMLCTLSSPELLISADYVS